MNTGNHIEALTIRSLPTQPEQPAPGQRPATDEMRIVTTTIKGKQHPGPGCVPQNSYNMLVGALPKP